MSKRRLFQYDSPNIVIVPTISFCDGSPYKKAKYDKNSENVPKDASHFRKIMRNQIETYDRGEKEIQIKSTKRTKSDSHPKTDNKDLREEKCFDSACVQFDNSLKVGNKEILEATNKNCTGNLKHVLSHENSGDIKINLSSKSTRSKKKDSSRDNKGKQVNGIYNLVNQPPATNIIISNSNEEENKDTIIKNTDMHKTNKVKMAESIESKAPPNTEFNKAVSERNNYKCIKKHKTAQTSSIKSIVQITKNFDLNKFNYCHPLSTYKNVDISDLREKLDSKTKLKENSRLRIHDNPASNSLNREKLIVTIQNNETVVIKSPVKDKIPKPISKNKKVKKINIEINLIFKQPVISANKIDCINKENECMESENADLSFLDDINVDEIIESLKNCENECNIKKSNVDVPELSSYVSENKNTNTFLTEVKHDNYDDLVKDTDVNIKIDENCDFEISQNLMNKVDETVKSSNCSELQEPNYLKQRILLGDVNSNTNNDDGKDIILTRDKKYENCDVSSNKCFNHIAEANTTINNQLENNSYSLKEEQSEVLKAIKETCLKQSETITPDGYNHNVASDTKIDIDSHTKENISVIDNITDDIIDIPIKTENKLTDNAKNQIVDKNGSILKGILKPKPNFSSIEQHLSRKKDPSKITLTEETSVEDLIFETEFSESKEKNQMSVSQKYVNDSEIHDDAKFDAIDVETIQEHETVVINDNYDLKDNKAVVESVCNLVISSKLSSESAPEIEISKTRQNLNMNVDGETKSNRAEDNITQIQINSILDNIRKQKNDIMSDLEEKIITTDETNTDKVSREQYDHSITLETENRTEDKKNDIKKSVENRESIIENTIPNFKVKSAKMDNKIIQSNLIPKTGTSVSIEIKTPTELGKEKNVDKETNGDTPREQVNKSVESNSTSITNFKDKSSKTDNPKLKPNKNFKNGRPITSTSIKLEDNVLVKKLERRMLQFLRTPYTVTTTIHNGRFSKIFKCTGPHGEPYVIKMNNVRNNALGIEKDCMLMNIKEGIPHANLCCVRLINGFSFTGHWCFLMEYYPKNLYQALADNGKSFHIDVVQDLSRQLASAVTLLRNKNIVHSDIKPTHILLNSTNSKLKLCGFDRAYYIKEAQMLPNVGTINYRAPEIILGYSFGYSIDVWSTGLVIFEMATKKQLFPGTFNNNILYKQMCTLGPMPSIILRDSFFKETHFCGTSFLRRVGVDGKNIVVINNFEKNSRLVNSLFETYNKDWASVRNEVQRIYDLAKMRLLHQLLQQMLNMNPNVYMNDRPCKPKLHGNKVAGTASKYSIIVS